MVEVNKKSWHFRIYSWFNQGKLLPVINLCSYCRTVMFWAPLKFVFYSPAAWLHRKNKALSYVALVFLVVAIDGLMLSVFHTSWFVPYFFSIFVYLLFTNHPRLEKTVVSDWDEAKGTKFVRYTEKTRGLLLTGLKYSMGLPLKAILWTIWTKMYDFNKVFFWSALCLAVVAVSYGLYLIGWWRIALGVVTGLVLFLLLLYLIFEGKMASIKDSLVWQFLVAQKRKICPFIEPRDGD